MPQRKQCIQRKLHFSFQFSQVQLPNGTFQLGSSAVPTGAESACPHRACLFPMFSLVGEITASRSTDPVLTQMGGREKEEGVYHPFPSFITLIAHCIRAKLLKIRFYLAKKPRAAIHPNSPGSTGLIFLLACVPSAS